MILREEPDGGILAVAQPAHAALAGRLAAAWGEELSPDLLLATAHHDDVWAQHDAAPPLNPETGRPVDLFELVDEDRVPMWSRAPEVAAPLGPEAALWVLRHAERLHAGYDAAAVKAMTTAISARIGELIDELRATGPRFDDAELARGTSLVTLFDRLSLRLCFGVRQPVDAGVLRLTPLGDELAGAAASHVAVAPWPFAGARVESYVEARRLPGRFSGQAELDAAWAATAPVAVPITLLPPP